MKKLLIVSMFAFSLALLLGLTFFAKHRSGISNAQSRAFRECGRFLNGDNHYKILNIVRTPDRIEFNLSQGANTVHHSVWLTNKYFDVWSGFKENDKVILNYSEESVDTDHVYDPEAYECPEKEQ